MTDIEKMLDDLLERLDTLRLEHYHPTMEWVAYYARKDKLSAEDAIEFMFPGKSIFDLTSDTPLGALQNLKQAMQEEGIYRA